ncbi:WD40-repeat-containing domain protein [Mycotypha africana]|uniref:WD40-repeat-containing domain protein n=1 Tax=Mycotypha africana TaxID=64632 RepID=UPI0023011741|nr:WD40-repeat-containing domain protein [Mycotypha africana]KAI8987234.1 WD40-repeat-containing domain protein [Mycotypha africana]
MDLTDKFPKFTSYPPVPNWYSFNIAAIVEPDFFLYATRNIVVVLSLSGLRYFTSFIASKDKKVVALAAHGTFCVTAGSDNIVRVWNLILGSHLTSHSAHQAEITTLKLIRNGSTVISGDKSGKIVIMDLFAGGKLKSETKVKAEVTSIATTVVDDQDYVAVGYGNGLIFVEKLFGKFQPHLLSYVQHQNSWKQQQK